MDQHVRALRPSREHAAQHHDDHPDPDQEHPGLDVEVDVRQAACLIGLSEHHVEIGARARIGSPRPPPSAGCRTAPTPPRSSRRVCLRTERRTSRRSRTREPSCRGVRLRSVSSYPPTRAELPTAIGGLRVLLHAEVQRDRRSAARSSRRGRSARRTGAGVSANRWCTAVGHRSPWIRRRARSPRAISPTTVVNANAPSAVTTTSSRCRPPDAIEPSARTAPPTVSGRRQAAPQVRARRFAATPATGRSRRAPSSRIESGTMNDWKNDGPTDTFVPTHRLGHERVDGSPEHDHGHRREAERPSRGTTTPVMRPIRSDRGRRASGRRHTISPADTTTTSPVNPSSSGPIVDSANAWTDDTTPDRVRNVPKIAERERRREQRDVPRLHDAALLLHRRRVQEDRGREPRQQARVLHRVPGPVAAPAELDVGPARARGGCRPSAGSTTRASTDARPATIDRRVRP